MPEERLELSSLAARDFESRMVTNFITPALAYFTIKNCSQQFRFAWLFCVIE